MCLNKGSDPSLKGPSDHVLGAQHTYRACNRSDPAAYGDYKLSHERNNCPQLPKGAGANTRQNELLTEITAGGQGSSFVLTTWKSQEVTLHLTAGFPRPSSSPGQSPMNRQYEILRAKGSCESLRRLSLTPTPTAPPARLQSRFFQTSWLCHVPLLSSDQTQHRCLDTGVRPWEA